MPKRNGQIYATDLKVQSAVENIRKRPHPPLFQQKAEG
jgi:hypothetical protein